MKNWHIIILLILFFPIGIYTMFKHSSWSNFIKFGITAFFSLVLFIGGVDLFTILFFLGSLISIGLAAISFFRKSSKRKSVGLLITGVILFAFSAQALEAQEAERDRIEQIEIEMQAEKDRIAEEKKQEEIAKKEEQKRIEEEEKLKEEIVLALEKVEKEPTKANYDEVVLLLRKLNNEDTKLTERLEKLKPAVDEYEEELEVAGEALKKAQTEKNWDTYDHAYELIAALSIPNSRLTRQLETLDKEITKIEEEKKIAEEKAEKERLAAEEEERKAAEEAERKAAEEAAQQAAEQTSQQSQQSNQQSVPPTEPVAPEPPTDNVGTVVYIAPQSGTKYHYSPSCRGLNNANSVVEIDLNEAINQGYDLCGWEN